MSIVGVVLAGGQSRRMGGGDKAFRLLGGISLLERAITRLRPQVEAIVINANSDPARFAGFGLPVVADSIPGFAGPLAGVLAALDWAACSRPQADFVVSVATDAPFLPTDLVVKLAEGAQRTSADLACAASGGRPHPVFGLWSVRLREELRHAVAVEGLRKVDAWTGRYKLAIISFPDSPVDPFFNANRPEDLVAAAAIISDSEPR